MGHADDSELEAWLEEVRAVHRGNGLASLLRVLEILDAAVIAEDDIERHLALRDVADALHGAISDFHRHDGWPPHLRERLHALQLDLRAAEEGWYRRRPPA